MGEKEDVYIGCGLAPRAFGPHQRCPADQIVGIPALWLDIDIKGVGHKKQNLPPDAEAAHGLIRELDIPPSAIVHSGHGLQAWWILKDFWRLETTAARTKAMALAKAWTDTWRARAQSRGWDIDATGDLARVMRLPGLWNRKADPVPTRLLSITNTIYSREDIERHCLKPAGGSQSSGKTKEVQWHFTLRPDADAPTEKFIHLADSDPLFRQTWQHTNPDLKDTSLSGYDFDLAKRALAAGWTPQEIVNLLVAHRRKYGADLKQRRDYYERTLSAASGARCAIQQERHVAALRQGGELPPDVLKNRDQCLAIINSTLNCQITRLIRYAADPNQYELEINGKLVLLRTVDKWTSQSKFRNAVCDAGAGWFKPQNPKVWDQLVRALIGIIEDVETSPEATERGSVVAWLEAYQAQGVEAESNWERAIASDAPAWHGKNMVFTLAGIHRFVTVCRQERVTERHLVVKLRRISCTVRTENIKGPNEKRTTKRVWTWKPGNGQP